MMPLNLADVGTENIIQHVSGGGELRQHLADLGFVVGSPVTLVSTIGGNVIAKVKESRVAIDETMARKIMI
jgi:ferrous iron transport protein A